MHATEISHVNSWRHAGLHAAGHFQFLESYLTKHGLGSHKLESLLPVAKYVLVRHRALCRTKAARHLVRCLTTTCSTRDKKSSNAATLIRQILKCRLIDISQIANQRRIRSTNWSHLHPWFHPHSSLSTPSSLKLNCISNHQKSCNGKECYYLVIHLE